jgi:hypothetical protein
MRFEHPVLLASCVACHQTTEVLGVHSLDVSGPANDEVHGGEVRASESLTDGRLLEGSVDALSF